MFTICVFLFAGFSPNASASECHYGQNLQQAMWAVEQCRDDDMHDPIMTCEYVLSSTGVIRLEYTDITTGWTVGQVAAVRK